MTAETWVQYIIFDVTHGPITKGHTFFGVHNTRQLARTALKGLRRYRPDGKYVIRRATIRIFDK